MLCAIMGLGIPSTGIRSFHAQTEFKGLVDMWSFIADRVTSRYGRVVSILIWISAPIALFLLSPSLTDVSSSNQEDFLPTGVESTKAMAYMQQHFPTGGIPGILVYRNEGGISQEQLLSIENDVQWLRTQSGEGFLGDITSIFDSPDLDEVLFSPDKSTMLVFFSVVGSTAFTSEVLQSEIKILRDRIITDRDDDLTVWLTGPVGIFDDAVRIFLSIDLRITLTSVLIVLVILLAIYRAPILAVLPIISAGLAYMAASAIVAILADSADLIVTSQATSIMVVLIFGAGTDYTLFISSRFKEQLSRGVKPVEGISESLARIGPPIVSSALTTIFSMLALGLATLRSFQILGPILALGMVFAIIAGLTFMPAVLSLLGKKAYWPTKIPVIGNEARTVVPNSGFWARVGAWVGKRPLFTALSSVILLLAMSTGVLTIKPSFDLLGSLPRDTSSVQGYEIMKESFPAGSVDPTTVIVVLNDDVVENLEVIDSITILLNGVDGVHRVTSPSRPFGYRDTLLEVEDVRSNLPVIPSSECCIPGVPAIEQLSSLGRERIQSDGLGTIEELVEDGEIAPEQIGLASVFALMTESISQSGDVARIQVIFEGDPGALETLDKIEDLRNILETEDRPIIEEILVGGNTAVQFDTREANRRDIKVIAPVVLAIIFVILAILVRALVAPLYLLGSVLLSFLGSLGISVYFFQNVLGHDGVGSGVPIFMFLFLVALGVDYNIYIISRVKEESDARGIQEGTLVAVSKTGGVITSAGLILAGTFTALATLPLRDLFQLGFVVSLGVLIDTFFVRGIVVPSFVFLFGKWNWWPNRTLWYSKENSLTE